VSSGMGTCGLVGQIGVYSGWVSDVASGAKAAIVFSDWFGLVMISFILPAALALVFNMILRKIGWVKDGDMKLA
ncbi:MAG: PTS sugar transporter subunit IIC, partial [Spirochaetales bacterium]|nr:PTS sugar transporter subunit IIC [Spirochaetales bacterium]